MDSLTGVAGKTVPAQTRSPSCLKKCAIALAIIAMLGGAAVGGVGLAGFFNVGALSNMAQIKAIIMMASGGGAAGVVSILGMIIGVKKCCSRCLTTTLTPKEQFAENAGKGVILGYSYFGPEGWLTSLSINVLDIAPLPGNFDAILDEQCPFSGDEKIRVKHTHMLVLIPATMQSASATTKRTRGDKNPEKSFSLDNLNGMSHLMSQGWSVERARDDKPTKNLFQEKVEEAHWVLMTRDEIPGSRKLSYEDQMKITAQYSLYRLPSAQEIAACAFAERAAQEPDAPKSRKVIFDSNTTVLCSDTAEGYPVVVGGNLEGQLSVSVFPFTKPQANAKRGVVLVRPL